MKKIWMLFLSPAYPVPQVHQKIIALNQRYWGFWRGISKAIAETTPWAGTPDFSLRDVCMLLYCSLLYLSVSSILFQGVFKDFFLTQIEDFFSIQSSLCGYAALSVTAGRQTMQFCFTQRHLVTMNTPIWWGATGNICSSSSMLGWSTKQIIES